MQRRTYAILAVVAAVLLGAMFLFVAWLMLSTGGAARQPMPSTTAPLDDVAPKKMEVSARARPPPPPPIVVERNGARRASCQGACDAEARCFMRDSGECAKKSCGSAPDDAFLRKPNRSDFCLADAVDCAAAAICPCEEACWKRGECTGDHKHDKECTATCAKLVQQDPIALYVENRCVIESACGDVALCGGVK